MRRAFGVTLMRRLILAGLLLTRGVLAACPVVPFQNVASTSLSPTATTRLNLARQAEGSYTGYQIGQALPHGVVSVSPGFQKQLTACVPAGSAAAFRTGSVPAGTSAQVQATAVVASGNYLVVGLTATRDAEVTVFDPSMNFISTATYAVNGSLLSLVDMNGDGKLDIVAVGGGNITILLGNGGSSFQAPVVYSVLLEEPYQLSVFNSFAVGDLNGDGKPDLVLTVEGSLSVNVLTYFGKGDGTISAGPSTPVPSTVTAAALGDLNGDGKLDLVFGAGSPYQPLVGAGDYVGVALGAGDGSFAAPVYISVNAPGSSIAIGDMNRDGIPDIVTSATILFGDGKGGFPKRQDYQNSASGAVILTDFDGDGRVDVVISGGSPALLTGMYGAGLTVLFGRADGTFFGPPASFVPVLAMPNTFLTNLQAADFNGDGIPDVVYAGAHGVTVMLGKGDGTFAVPPVADSGTGWEVATGDFNGDGKRDIAAIYSGYNGPGTLSFFAGNGDGTLQSPVTVSIPVGASGIVAGDFDHNGKLDLALLFSTEEGASADVVTIYLGNGDGSFQAGMSYQAGRAAQWMGTGDLNHDGNIDLIITSSQGGAQSKNLITLLGRGDGTFVMGTGVVLEANVVGNYGPSIVTLADFNLDGNLDVAVGLTAISTAPTGFAILLGKGDGTFQTPLITRTTANSLAAADVNDDGIPDLVVLSPTLSYMIGNGDGSFQPPISLQVQGAPSDGLEGAPLLIADFNRDGKPDLVSTALPFGLFAMLNLTSGPPAFRVVSSASFAPGPVAADSFVSAIGTNLPAWIGGLSIMVTDAVGVSRQATVLYASATQVNFIMPAGSSAGVATVSMAGLSTQVQIVPVKAGLFTLNANGLAAAYAVRVDAAGNQTTEPVYVVQGGKVIASPINLGAATDQIYLALFGTGFDNLSAGDVSVQVGGQSAMVSYCGPQGLAGLDQINVLLPRQLAGSGDSAVVVSVGGFASNVVRVTIQ
jgi:uncharacterized protein (TIGR03437 family)